MPDKVIVHIVGKEALKSAVSAGKSVSEALAEMGTRLHIDSKTILWDGVALPGLARRFYINPREPIDLSDFPQNECRQCCHFQTHPPRCRLSKHAISPKQFACKKYSPKHNPR